MTTPSASAQYQAWRTTAFGSDYAIYHDGLDFAPLLALGGEERVHAVEMLSVGLAAADWVAVGALAALGEVSVVPELRRLVATATGKLKVTAALAIRELTGDLSVISFVTDELRAEHWGHRIDAVLALVPFAAHPSVLPTLIGVIRDDPDYLPRYHAAQSIRTILGSSAPDIDQDKALFDLICKGDGDSKEARASRRAAAEVFEKRIV